MSSGQRRMLQSMGVAQVLGAPVALLEGAVVAPLPLSPRRKAPSGAIPQLPHRLRRSPWLMPQLRPPCDLAE